MLGLYASVYWTILLILLPAAESTSSSKPKLKWLPSDSEELWGCVHLYGGGLGSHNIVDSKEYQRSEEKEWKDAIAKADEVDGFLADA